MSPRASRRVLWLALAVLAPLPVLLGVATGWMPVVRILLLAGAAAGVLIVENANGQAPLFILLLGIQAAGWLLVLWIAAFLGARALAALAPRRVGLATAVLVLAGVLMTASFDLYQTPFRRDGTRASLLEVLD